MRRPPGVAENPESLGGVPALRTESPSANRDRGVLYLHGGGYVAGTSRTYGPFGAWIANVADAPVHLLDYRLAPEHPYPAAVDDAVAAYRELVDSGPEPRGIVIAGDSAGASLAVAVALRLRQAGEPMPAGLLLINGWLDLSCSGPSMAANAKRDVGLRRSWLLAAGEAYRGAHDIKHPEISSVEAELDGLPPIHIQVGTWDLLLSDSDFFAERARTAGVKVSYRRFEAMWHDFQLAAGQLREADEAIRDIGEVLRRLWGESPEAVAPAGAQPSTRAE
jgi:epsilon-lactone hydrolase